MCGQCTRPRCAQNSLEKESFLPALTRRMYPVRMETERQGVSLNLDHIPRDWRRLVVSLISGEINKHLRYLIVGAPGWRSRLSVRLQPGHDLAVREFEPRVGSGLMARSLEPVSASAQVTISQSEFKPHVGLCAHGPEPGACFGFCASLSLSAPPPPLTLCVSLSLSKIK